MRTLTISMDTQEGLESRKSKQQIQGLEEMRFPEGWSLAATEGSKRCISPKAKGD